MAQRKRNLQRAGNQQGRGRGGATRFQPGESGNPVGRVKGSHNKATLEIRRLCREIVEDPTYWRNRLVAARAGKLPPAVECLLLHYAYGKPKEQVEHQGVIRLFWIGEESPAE